MNHIKKFIISMAGYLIVMALVLLTITVLALFGGVFMHIFGFEYESVGTLIIFFVLVSAISIPIEPFSNAITAVLERKKIFSDRHGLLYIAIDATTTFLLMSLVDFLMDSISATPLSILLFAITMALITVYLGKKGL